MKIKSIQLKNFKRFTDLTINNIPTTSKLILVIGSNGSGKSSLFDAFDWLNKALRKDIPYGSENYYKKDPSGDLKAIIELDNNQIIEKTETRTEIRIDKGQEYIKKFFGRSSIRIVPRITNSANTSEVVNDMDSPLSYIENDNRFINDVFLYIQEINNALREPVFSGKQADTLKIFKDFIEPLNNSLLKIFGGDETTTIQIAEFADATPQRTAKLIFKKGQSKINYDLLSHGEKQVVILLINFIVRHKYYEDSIIFIDEMDSHLNTSLQANLMEEIVSRWIPSNAQLWTASHALGFIDYAKKSEFASIIDFNLLDFDLKKELSPLPKNTMEVYEIAIPKATIASILKEYKLIIVENKNDAYYNAALGGEGYLFLPANNNREVFLTVKGDKDKLGLRDRDYLREDEIKQIKEKLPNLKILNLYTFENYIYHPNNIAELKINGYDQQEYIAEITRQKNDKLLSIVGESNIFEEFYIFFNMKKHFNKNYIEKWGCSGKDLCQTTWFKTQILSILNEV